MIFKIMVISKVNFLLCKKIEDSFSLLARGFPIIIDNNLIFGAEFFDDGVFEFLLNEKVQKYNIAITNRRANFLNISFCNDSLNNSFIILSCDRDEIFKVLNYEIKNYEFEINNNVDISKNAIEKGMKLMKISRFLPVVLIHKLSDSRIYKIVEEFNIPKLSNVDIDEYCKIKNDAKYLEEVSRSIIALKDAKNSEIRIFRDALFFGRSHIAIIIGDMNSDKIPAVRVHSGCYTGDLLNSLQCDCHDQLHSSIQYMNKIANEEDRYGVIIYQAIDEGRAIGLANKIRAYNLQYKNYNTIEANNAIGYEDDERDFTTAANIMKKLNIYTCDLITNNPEKIGFFVDNGINISNRIFIEIDSNSHNIKYLKTKKELMGHYYS